VNDLLLAGLCNAAWASVLAVVALVASRLWRHRPALAHGLWLLVLLKLVTPSLLHVSQSQSAAPIAMEPTVAERPIAAPRAAEAVVSLAAPETINPSPDVTSPPIATDLLKQDTSPVKPPWPWQSVLIAVWLVGAVMWWLAVAVGAARFRKLIRAGCPATGSTRERAGRMAELLGLRRCPAVELIPARIPPMLWALAGRPRLLLPDELWRRLSDMQKDAVLAHELAHLKRRDHWVRRLEAAVLGLYWWDPIAWWARREVESAEEECCDALVVASLPESAGAYAEALVATAAFLSGPRLAWPAGASGAGRTPLLKRRLSMILGNPTAGSASRPGSLNVLIFAALALPFLPALVLGQPSPPAQAAAAQDKPQSEPQEPAPPKAKEEPKAIERKDQEAEKPKSENPFAISQPLVREVNEYAIFTGRTAARQTVELRARVSGMLDKVDVQAGQIVEKDTVLFEIDPRPYRAELDRAVAEVNLAQSRVKRASSDLKRAKSLMQKNMVSQEEVAQVEGQADEAEAALRVTQASLELAKLKLSFTKVTAPVSGKIGRPLLSEGNLVAADTTLLARMVSQDTIYVEFAVDERTLLRLNRLRRERKLKGAPDTVMPVEIGLSDEPGFPHRGIIDSMDIEIDPTTGTARWRAAVPNPDGILVPGLFARVQLLIGGPVKALLINKEAILNDTGRRYVFVVNDKNVVEQRYVNVLDGAGYANLAAITKGLKADDWVLVRGMDRLRPANKLIERAPQERIIDAEKIPMKEDMPPPAELKAS
jgi:RND family efflux transporter MFP subunit